MKYVMFICGPADEDWEGDPNEAAAQMKLIEAWMEEQGAAGAIAHPGFQLDAPATARTIRPGANGEAIVTDGPFVEAQEVIGGLVVLEYDTIEHAIEAAAGWVRINPTNAVELRPTLD